MTASLAEKIRARALQSLVEDETNAVPSYQMCLQVVRKHVQKRGECASEEEFLCRVFDAEWPEPVRGS